jgi:cytochrome b subunit of formate dehydrogenase
MNAARARWLLVALVLIAGGAAAAAPLSAAGNDDCMACHSDATLTMERRGRTIPLHVDAAALAGSPHKDAACADCHAGFKADELPHKAKITPVNCMDCHGDAPAAHVFHSAMARATGTDGEPGTSCKGCHGTHDVRLVRGPGSKFQPQKLPETCGTCHEEIARTFSGSEHGRALASAEAGAPDCLACHREPLTPARGAATEAELKQTQEKACVACHVDNPDVRARMGPDARFIASYESSVHGRALLSGNAAAPTCIDCHGSHEMKRGSDPSARVSRLRTPETCSACHDAIARDYTDSVHGAALARGNTEAPVCTDCHGEHTILRHTDPKAPVAAANVSQQVCSPCHSSVRLSEKYGISSDRFQTFADSYHGLAVRGGAVETANCASCHGSHGIRPSTDPASTIHKDNLAHTCGNCHPGANQRFATGAVHVVMTAGGEPVLYWIAAIYIVLIVATIGGMFAHNLLDFLRKSQRILHERRHGTGPIHHGGAQLYERMSLNERLQHGTLLVSFIVLAVTGFMLSYPEAWWVRGIRGVVPGLFETRSLMHRVAAVAMTAVSLYHVGYLAFTARGRRLVRDLLPALSDVWQAIANLKYLAWLSRVRPRFGRFGYIEKAEYWALVWGTIVMVGTGFVMWFENTSMQIITKLGWDIARTIHFYEAVLATLAILVWHIYFVVLNPDIYPMNLAWLTGKLSEAEMAEEHPAELDELQQRDKESESDREAS